MSDSQYYDINGAPVSLIDLVATEPSWAVSEIQRLESENKRLVDADAVVVDKNQMADVLWRLGNIREMLMDSGVGGTRLYGCDEWSTPTVNLASAIKLLEALAREGWKND